MNDNLLSSVASDDKIASKLNNPQFMAAFAEFQTNPDEAAKKYGDNKEMQDFIQAFSGLLGNHFTGLHDKKTTGG